MNLTKLATNITFEVAGQWDVNVNDGNTNIVKRVTYSLPSPNDRNWHHATGFFSRANSTGTVSLSLYVDGNGPIYMSEPGNPLPTNDASLVIGNDAGTYTDRFFYGAISDVRIWNIPRSQNDIVYNYQYRLIGSEPGLIGYWKLDEDSATYSQSNPTSFSDSTSYKNNGISSFISTNPVSWISTPSFAPVVRIGTNAGEIGQQSGSVAIGFNAGQTAQGKNAIAIGNQAGQNQQPQNSIVLNASGSALSGTKENALYVTPIREDTASGVVALGYNPLTKEVTYFNNYSSVLWASGSLITTTDTAYQFIDWSSFAGPIELNKFNIRYEIECYWNYSNSSYPGTYIIMGPNNMTASDNTPNADTSNTYVGGVTNWTNIMAGGTWSNITQEFNQSYRNRFMCGFAHQISAGLTEQRCRTFLTGEMSLQNRPTAQSGITDPSPEERNIFNRFTCNNYTTQRVSGTWFTYQLPLSDTNNSCMRLDGTATFAAQTYWNGFLASGINRIGLRLNDGFTPSDTRPRGAQYIYRIFRVRK